MPSLLEPILHKDEAEDSEERLIRSLEKISSMLMINMILIVTGVLVVIALLFIAVVERL